METTAGAAAATSPNRVDRARVIDYYAHCWNDYRILWRTDETGSVHFGTHSAYRMHLCRWAR